MTKYCLTMIVLIVSLCCHSQGLTSFKKFNEELNYRWNFERNYDDFLEMRNKVDLPPSKYFSLSYLEGAIWTRNWQSNTLLKIEENLQGYKNHGKKGFGPPEGNGKLMFFNILKDSYSVYDFDKQLFKVFDYEDKLISYHKNYGLNIYRGTGIGTESYLIFDDEDSDGTPVGFYVYNFKNKKESERISLATLELTSITDQKEFLGQLFDGKFVTSSSRDYSLFYCRFGGGVFLFDKRGQLLYFKTTVDETPFPKIKKKDLGGGQYTLAPDPNYSFFLSAALNDSYIYLLNNISKKESKTIDVYSIDGFKYVKSFVLPDLVDGQRATEITVNGNVLYVLYENNTLISYEIKT